jgi:hypothetical protein
VSYPWVDGDPLSSTFVVHGPLSGSQLTDVTRTSIFHTAGGEVAAHTDFDGDGRDDLLAGSGIYRQ